MMHALAVAPLLAAGCAAAPPPQDPEAAVARLLPERIAAAGDTAPVAGALPATLSRFYSARAEVIPAQIRDSTYLRRTGIRVFPVRPGREIDPTTVDWRKVNEHAYAYRLVQDPGPRNPLGVVRLYALNPFGVTLHDTPQRGLFAEPVRAFSHGCVRVERALDLAKLLLRDVGRWTPDTIAAVLRAGRERAAVLPEAVPVVFAYWTAWVDDGGVLQFSDDLYGWDARLASALAPPRSASPNGTRTSASSECQNSP